MEWSDDCTISALAVSYLILAGLQAYPRGEGGAHWVLKLPPAPTRQAPLRHYRLYGASFGAVSLPQNSNMRIREADSNAVGAA